MRKIALLALSMAVLLLFTGCFGTKQQEYKDGVYKAEFKEFDSRGYKDYLVLIVEGGKVVSIEFDSVDAQGHLLSQDEKIEKEMQEVLGNTPKQIKAGLENQYMENKDMRKVDEIAGATYSTNSFKVLFKALEPEMESGNTGLILIDNVPEK